MVNERKKKRRKNPVTALSKGLEEDLRRQGYAASTLWKQRRLLNDLIDWLQGQQFAMGDLSMAQVDRFMADRRAAGVRKLKTRKALGPILGYLRGLGLVAAAETPVVDDPAQIILNRFRQFLITERGLATVTADRYIDCLRPFLDRSIDRSIAAGELSLGGLTPVDVTSFVVTWCPCLNSGVAKLTVTALRSFLGCLHLDGVTERSLVHAVPKVCRRRLAGLPKSLEPDQVRRLLAACDAGTAVGCRDLAILMRATQILRGSYVQATYRVLIGLLAVTGMRVGEAIALDQGDFDAGGGMVTIRHGTFDKARALPLHPTTVAALQDYLRRDDRPRPAGTPTLLISSRGKRLRYTVVQPIFQKRLHHCGIVPRSAACRPRIHDLRHSFAVTTIADDYRSGEPGSRLAILSTYLGHADPGDTYWYLSAAPELLGLAGERLERHLDQRMEANPDHRICAACASEQRAGDA